MVFRMQCKTNVLACNLGESIAMQMTTKSAINSKQCTKPHLSSNGWPHIPSSEQEMKTMKQKQRSINKKKHNDFFQMAIKFQNMLLKNILILGSQLFVQMQRHLAYHKQLDSRLTRFLLFFMYLRETTFNICQNTNVKLQISKYRSIRSSIFVSKDV